MRSIVWFKKDLRTNDHEPLFLASQSQECIGLYIVEPRWLSSYEFDESHWQFLKESLSDLALQLAKWNIPLVVRCGDVPLVFRDLYKEWCFDKVFSHEETGVDWTFQRDIQVAHVFKSLGVEFRELMNFGVFRRFKNRDVWAQKRMSWLNQKLSEAPRHQANPPQIMSLSLQAIEDRLGIRPTPKNIQRGGSAQAQETLISFLNSRGESYLADISKPELSRFSSSRLSPYLSFGALSVREVHNAVRSVKRFDAERLSKSVLWRKSLWAFENRLWWHCHFIQKMETEPDIEFRNMNRSFDQLREPEFNDSFFKAWCAGQTGYPLVDASMRCLLQTGWVNFRMRAMLVSFASYHLWLHWLRPAQYLAKHFLDFEPGIHFSQFQMQSGVTGINAIRIYSPEKQVLDNDPTGAFIREFCPELEAIPQEYIHQPSLTPPLLQMAIGCRIGIDYPEPIVDSQCAYKKAKQRIFDWKRMPEVQQAGRKVYQKHGSREGRHFPKQKRQS